MRKLLSFLIFCLAVTLNARQITVDEATAIASEFLNSSSTVLQAGKCVDVYRAQSKEKVHNVEDNQPFYVFNAADSNGFVIISGDERLGILGYSNSGVFDFENLPPQLKWLMNEYENEYSSILKYHSYVQNEVSEESKSEISPLLQTQWGQGSPYNLKCPEFEGKNMPAGCVATACAQIIAYHKWPEKGEGVFSYDYEGSTKSFDYENTMFDWSMILDRYEDDSPMLSKEEVSKLINACDVGLEMYYSPAGSGSGISQTKRFLVENMKYDTDAKIVWRHNYSTNEWHELIYNELISGRPIYIEGEGHAFVCDGYDGNGFFHFNWGWEGDFDGYFTFTNLTPQETNYSHGIHALVNIHKREGEFKPLTYDLYSTGSVLYKDNYFEFDQIWNYSRYDFNGKVGFDVIDIESGNSTFISLREDINIEGAMPDGIGVHHFASRLELFFSPFNLPQGNYKLFPAYSTTSIESYRIPFLAGGQKYLLLSIDADGNQTITNPGYDAIADIEISDIQCNYSISNYEFSIEYLINNKTDYPIPLPDVLLTNELGNVIISGGITFVPIEPNTITKGGFGEYPVYLRAGRHTLKMFDFTGNMIGEPYDIQIEGDNPGIEVKNVKLLSVAHSPLGGPHVYEMLLTFNTPLNVNIPITFEFSKNGQAVYECMEKISWNSEYDVVVRPATPGDRPLYGIYNVNIRDNYGVLLNDEPFEIEIVAPEYEFAFEFGNYEFSGLKVGEELHLSARPQIDGNIIDYFPGTEWFSSDTSVATVVNDGTYGCILSALSPGKTTITVKSCDGSGKTASCEIIITQLAESLTINPQIWSGEVGATFQISTIILPENTSNKALEWTSSDTSIAMVDNTGIVTLVKEGQCIISASTTDGSNLIAECKIDVLSGIKEVFADGDTVVDVFNVQGVLIKKNCGKKDLQQFTPGIYIIRSATDVVKIFINK